MTRFQLKVILMIAMTINHLGYYMNDIWTNALWIFVYKFSGTLVFPTLLILMQESWDKTTNRTEYLKRLCWIGFLSILPFSTLPFNHQHPFVNIYFTLMAVWLGMKLTKQLPLLWLLTLWSDWGMVAIPLSSTLRKLGYRTTYIVFTILMIILFTISGKPIDAYASIGYLLPILLMKWYNGKEGYKTKISQWAFYYYYPLHLILLYTLTHFWR